MHFLLNVSTGFFRRAVHMENNDKLLFEISDLVVKTFDNSISEEKFERLQHLLKMEPAALDYYFDLLFTFASIDEIRVVDSKNNQMDYGNLLLELGEYELTAPEIEVPKEEVTKELIQKVVYSPREKREVSKLNIFLLALSTAAMLFFILYIKFVPPKASIEVATITDSVNANWSSGTGYMDKGTRLATSSDALFLQDGLTELLFDNNAKVVIEGPAEFELHADNQINLRYGRIYATVPRDAVGFTINTPTSRIIDLGTEFGVQANALGDVYLHVIKGKTTLLAGDNTNRVKLEVSEGQAKKVSAVTLAVSDVPCDTELFVRDLSSEQQYAQGGELEIDFVNIIAGDITTGKDSLVYKQGTINRKLWTYFRPEDDPVSLAVGEQLIVTIEFSPLGNLYDNSVRGFRFGLFNDPTNNQILTYTDRDSGGKTDPWTDATGYGVQMALSKGPRKSATPSVGKRTDLTYTSLMGSVNAWTFSDGGDPITNVIDTRYTLTLTLDRITENQMQATFTIADADGVISSHTILDDPLGTGEFGSGPIATDFDQLFFRFSSADSTADSLEFRRFTIEYIQNEATPTSGLE